MEIVIISQNKWNKAMSIKRQKHLPSPPLPPPPHTHKMGQTLSQQ